MLTKMDEEKADKMFNKIMKSLPLDDSDYFREGCTTILNNYMAALKRCHTILKSLQKDGRKFYRDLEFGPSQHGQPGLQFICFEEDNPPYWVPPPENIAWRRLSDICPEDKSPHFLLSGADSGDVIQGNIGDCWLISGMSVLANEDSYIR